MARKRIRIETPGGFDVLEEGPEGWALYEGARMWGVWLPVVDRKLGAWPTLEEALEDLVAGERRD